MRIGKKNFAFRLLDGKVEKMTTPYQGRPYAERIKRFVNKLAKTHTKVYVLSSNFSESMIEASEMILQAWHKDQIQLENPIQCCLLHWNGQSMVADFAELRPVGNRVKGRVMQYTSDFHVLNYIEIETDPEDMNSMLLDGYCAKSILAKSETDKTGNFNAAWTAPLVALLYMQFGEIQTKRVCNSKLEAFPGMSLKNDTDRPVIAVNSTWLNNLVRNKSFKVSGHFRLQRVGKGLQKTKLVWIDSYSKSGYNRAAKRWKEMPTDESE